MPLQVPAKHMLATPPGLWSLSQGHILKVKRTYIIAVEVVNRALREHSIVWQMLVYKHAHEMVQKRTYTQAPICEEAAYYQQSGSIWLCPYESNSESSCIRAELLMLGAIGIFLSRKNIPFPDFMTKASRALVVSLDFFSLRGGMVESEEYVWSTNDFWTKRLRLDIIFFGRARNGSICADMSR